MSAQATFPDAVVPAQAGTHSDAPTRRHSRASGNPVTFVRYAKYKDSGVEWLGEVPIEWSIARLKDIAQVINGYPFDSKLFDSSGAYPLIRIRDLNRDGTETRFNGELMPEAIVTSADVLIGMDGDFNVGRWRGCDNALLNQRMCCIRSEDTSVSTILYYALPIPLKAINDITYATTVKHLSSLDVGNIRLAMPKRVGDRIKLAAFLDRETAKIDALIAEQEKLIALMKEKRQALISHAVTKGLDPNAPMKDSGIEWLGHVPAHWNIRALRTLANVVRGASPRPAGDPELFAGDFMPWVTVAEITKDESPDLTATSEYLTELGAQASRTFRAGTLLYSNSGATLGVPKLLCMDACANDGVVGFESLAQSLTTDFLYWFLRALTPTIRDLVKQGSGQPNLNTDIVGSIRIGLPPVDEQAVIVDSIKTTEDAFSTLSDQCSGAIELLKERRSALISAAVTGKIDVRDAGMQ